MMYSDRGEDVSIFFNQTYNYIFRAVARSENLGGRVILGGENVPPLVEIELTDLPKSGGARAPPAPPLATGLVLRKSVFRFSMLI